MIVQIKDGRGQHMKETEKKNYEIIKKFFLENPGSTQKECRDKTGYSVSTIRKHLRQLRKQ